MPLRPATDFPAAPKPEALEAAYPECLAALVLANRSRGALKAQSEINIAIVDKTPEIYFAELREQVNAGPKGYGGITDPAELRANLEMNCLPLSVLDGEPLDYVAFLFERRRLMAENIRQWVNVL